MSQPQPPDLRSRFAALVEAIDDRWPGGRRRAGGMALALLLEGGLLFLMLTLGRNPEAIADVREALTTFSVAPEAPPAPEPQSEESAQAHPRAAEVAAAEAPAAPAAPLPIRPSALPLPVPQATSAPVPAPPAPPAIRAVIRDRGDGPIGPAGSGARPGDSQRISGSGPNGEPLYAARWYREPGDAELAGYLSTATSAGWALINCRTVPGFRVEDCRLVYEYPANAGLGRAVLAAAWQFQVRPPRVGGQSQVGAWVRIRITYEIDRPRGPASDG